MSRGEARAVYASHDAADVQDPGVERADPSVQSVCPVPGWC